VINREFGEPLADPVGFLRSALDAQPVDRNDRRHVTASKAWQQRSHRAAQSSAELVYISPAPMSEALAAFRTAGLVRGRVSEQILPPGTGEAYVLRGAPGDPDWVWVERRLRLAYPMPRQKRRPGLMAVGVASR